MVDVNQRRIQTSPPDRRTLSQLTSDPKLIRYLENLYLDVSQTNPGNLELLIQLIYDATEQAGKAQGSVNVVIQQIADLLNSLILEPQVPAGLGALGKRIDDLEGLLLDLRPSNVNPSPVGLFSPIITTVVGPYTAPALDAYQPLTVRANMTAGAYTVFLPASPKPAQLINIKKIDSTATVVTIGANGSTIDGSAVKTIGSQYTNLQIQFNGTTWDVL